MASSPLRTHSHYHVRSISLPSRPHPFSPQVDEYLSRLKASEATFSSLSRIGNTLAVLEDMYDCFDELLLLPNTQKAFSESEKWVEEVLDGYMMLLDLCATVKDISLQTKQDVQGLLSILRRRRDANELGGYLISRNKAKKVIQKSLKDLKTIKINHKDGETTEICTLFKEVEAATVAVFESLLSYIAGTKSLPKPSGFSLVRKLRNGKNISSKSDKNANEFEKIDVALQFINKKTGKSDAAVNIENVQSQLGEMESIIQDLEEGLECLFRRLIKTRVSLLNILNH